MKHRLQTSILSVLAVVMMGVIVTFSGLHSAAYAANAANVLKIAPVRTDIQINPGQSKTIQVGVSNPTSQTIAITPVENDFVSADENGTPSLILDPNQYAPSHSLKRFLSPIAPVTIAPGKSAAIKVVITVPKDAQAGGYFGAIRFTPTSPDGGGQVNLSANAASLILLTVPGPVTEQMNLTNFEVQQKGKTASLFNSPDNLTAFVRFENKGNIQEGPFGKIAVKKGSTIVYEGDFNIDQPRDMVLPDGARRWDVPLKNISKFGHYTVIATFTYGQNNTTIEVQRTFWVIPVLAFIAAGAGILILAAIVFGIWFFLRSYKRRILRQHSAGNGQPPQQ